MDVVNTNQILEAQYLHPALPQLLGHVMMRSMRGVCPNWTLASFVGNIQLNATKWSRYISFVIWPGLVLNHVINLITSGLFNQGRLGCVMIMNCVGCLGILPYCQLYYFHSSP